MQIYPTSVRSTGHSAANALGRIGAFSAPYVASLDSVSFWIPAVTFGVVSLAAALANYSLKTVSERLTCRACSSCVRSLTFCLCSQETANTDLPQDLPAHPTKGRQLVEQSDTMEDVPLDA